MVLKDLGCALEFSSCSRSVSSLSHGQDLRSKVDALVQPLVDGHEMVGCVVGIIQRWQAAVCCVRRDKEGVGQEADGEDDL